MALASPTSNSVRNSICKQSNECDNNDYKFCSRNNCENNNQKIDESNRFFKKQVLTRNQDSIDDLFKKYASKESEINLLENVKENTAKSKKILQIEKRIVPKVKNIF